MTEFAEGFIAGIFVCLFFAAAIGIWLILAGEPIDTEPEPTTPILPEGWPAKQGTELDQAIAKQLEQ